MACCGIAGMGSRCVLVAELIDGVLRYRGHGIEVSRGMRRGVISDLGPAAKAINAAALTAERSAKAPIETAVVGVGGPHVRGMNSQGGISMGSRNEGDYAGGCAVGDRSGRGAWDWLRTARCCICCRSSLFWTIRAGFMIRWGWWGIGWRVCLHLSTCSGSAAQSVVTVRESSGARGSGHSV